MTLPHGYGLEEELHRLLRSRPPQHALGWVEAQVRARVIDVEPLEGGNSSAVHRLTLDGPPSAVILRRYVRDWVIDEPEVPGNEALVLRLLGEAPHLPVPRLLASDPDGSEAGVPTTLMSAVTGSVVWEPADMDSWLRGMVDVMLAIHSLPVSPELADWSPYAPELIPPPWTKYPWAWERALAAYAGPRPAGNRVFLHRDFHPGNILWTDGEITGVVDWTSSCAGPPEEDVAHCRMNLARHHDQETADRFLQLWLEATGRTEYNPYYDLVDIVSVTGEEPDEALDQFAAAAAAQLG
jgi:aminoglycoside phosphotransferase (APT) family kinase protein